VQQFDTVSKTAAIVSVLAILFLQLAFHPDMTPALLLLSLVAAVAGWIGARVFPRSIDGWWVLLAILAPGPLRLLVGREGSVLDVFWMAGLTASLLRTSSWTEWTLPSAGWRVLAAGWALTLSLAWPILVGRETGFDRARLTDLGAINSWAMLSAPHVVAWTTYVVWAQILGLLWLDRLATRFAAAPDDTPAAAQGLWIGATIASVVAVYQGTIDIGFLSTPFWTALARSPGTMLDPNAYGMCAALAAPVAILALHGRARGAIGTSAVVINLAGVWMSGSRTAFLCVLLATAAVLVALWRTSGGAMHRVRPAAIVGAVAATAIILWAADAIGPVRRLAELSEAPRAALSTALNRGPYGTTAWHIIRDYPVTGVGIGSYQIMAPDYWRRLQNDALTFDTAQNWWRHQAAELGVLGGLALFAWSAAIAWRVVAARTRPGRALQATIVRGLLAAIGICSFIQFLTQTPVVLLWFLLLVAWLGAITEERTIGAPDRRWVRAAQVVVAALAVGYAGAHLVLARGPLAVAERARSAAREYVVGTYPPEPLPGSGVFRWTGERARLVVPARSRWLVVRIWAAQPDINKNPVRVTFSTMCGVLFTEELRVHDPVSFGVVLPEDEDTLDVNIAVSRTWQPAVFAGTDTRRLGVGIVTDFVENRELALSQMHSSTWPVCASNP
jgi:hypothetical protein